MQPAPIALAATVHDPEGRMSAAIGQLADRLRTHFPVIALNISDATAPQLVETARSALGATIMVHPQGEATIGRARRDAVRMVMEQPFVLYSDLDHLLRWLEGGEAELSRVLRDDRIVDFLAIGRTPAAFAREPARLRETERLVNHTFRLLTGLDWDLMFAIRRVSARAAATIVKQSRVDTLANDVEWPLIARRAGLTLGYAGCDALFYRTMDEFGAAADSGDESVLEWIRRLEFAGEQARTMRQFLG